MKKNNFTIILTIFLIFLLISCLYAKQQEDTYTITLEPNKVYKGARDVTFCFKVTNIDPSDIYSVRIQAHNGQFEFDSAWGGYNGDWLVYKPGGGNSPITFSTSQANKKISEGETGNFYIKYSSFPDKKDCYDFKTTINEESPHKLVEFCIENFTRTISLSANPTTGIIANGVSTSIITVKVIKTDENGQLPEANVLINFTVSAGTLSSQTATTGPNGYCQVILTSPYSANDINSNITASDGNVTTNDIINFIGVTNYDRGNSIIDFREVPIEDDDN